MENEQIKAQILELQTKNNLTKREKKYLRKLEKKLDYEKVNKIQKFNQYLIPAIIILFILILGSGSYWLIKQFSKPLPGQFVPNLGNKHVENDGSNQVKYNSLPPTSGSHLAQKAQWGIHTEPIPDLLQLHNLEDGGIMIQYKCDNKDKKCTELINKLTVIVNKYPDKLILAPYPKLDKQIALTAWTRIDKFDEFNEERITAFINKFRGIDNH